MSSLPKRTLDLFPLKLSSDLVRGRRTLGSPDMVKCCMEDVGLAV